MADQADKREAEEEHCTTPRGVLARQPKRRKIVTTSPLSDTARRLLLVKCAAADQQPETTVPTVCSSSISSVTAPRTTDPSLLSTTAPIAFGSFVLQSSPASQPTPPVIRDMVIDQYPQLHVEEGTNSEWLVISRLLYRILTMILVLSIIILTIGSLLFLRSMDLWSILTCAYSDLVTMLRTSGKYSFTLLMRANIVLKPSITILINYCLHQVIMFARAS